MAAEPVEHDGVSHADIFAKLGELQGTVNALVLQLQTHREDGRTAQDRMNRLEAKLAWIAGVCFAAAVVLPVLITASAMRISFGGGQAAPTHLQQPR